MSWYVFCFIIGFGLLILEMHSATVYLLVLGISMIAMGLMDWFGWSMLTQLTATAVLAIGGLAMAYHYQNKRTSRTTLGLTDPDIGQTVTVITAPPQGLWRVHYRGCEWDAEPASAETPATQHKLRIVAKRGNILIIAAETN